MKQLEKIYKTQAISIVKCNDDRYTLNSKYKIGTIIISKNIATLQLQNSSSQKIFIEFDKLNGAYSNDEVVVQVLFNPKGKTKAKVVHIINAVNNEILVFCKDNQLYTVKEALKISDESLSLKDGDVALIKQNQIITTLGHISDPKIDEKISLYLYGEIERLNKYSTIDNANCLDKNRMDLTHLEFCTIDPASAKDHDDAIYFDKDSSELYIAIADVSSYVQEGSALDIEARKRAFSIYLPNKVLPMLPFELSTDLCSLVPNKPRPAFVFKIKLDIKNTKVVSSSLFEAFIESKHKHSYEYIDTILEENNSLNPHVILYKTMKQFRYKRLKNGFDFRNDEIRLILDDDESLVDFNVESSSPSHSLVEECMLLANQEAAKKLKQLGIFRVHDEPTPAKIKKLLDEVNILGLQVKLKADIHTTILSIQAKAKAVGLEQEVDELIIQSQQQASYSSVKKAHFGLGFSDYSHFTSPIRRYSDLILHRILKTHQIPKDIETICEDISTTEREIASLVWDYEDRKYARFLNNHINKNFYGRLVDIDNCIVKLNDQKIKGARVYLDNYKGEKLFSKVEIKIISVDIILKKVIGILI